MWVQLLKTSRRKLRAASDKLQEFGHLLLCEGADYSPEPGEDLLEPMAAPTDHCMLLHVLKVDCSHATHQQLEGGRGEEEEEVHVWNEKPD